MPVASSRTMTAYVSSAPKVSLSSRSQIDQPDAGLVSAAGANTVVSMIQTRKVVKGINVSHNKLGDEGCKELFRYLCTDEGRRYSITDIKLNSNGIGDVGLEAISDYLHDNRNLKCLFLQNNNFKGEPGTLNKFVASLNRSSVSELSFTTNERLSDAFTISFLSQLRAPHLTKLQLSTLGVTSAASPAIISYLTSPRCATLETLKCNGNNFGLRSFQSIVEALNRGNFTMQDVEFHGSRSIVEEEEDSDAGWNKCREELQAALVRNRMLKRRTKEYAMALLPIARTILLQPIHKPSNRCPVAARTASLWSLPMELQHHILGFLAPMLSPSQLTQIFHFASDPHTLPALFPPLQRSCIPDPSCVNFGSLNPSRCANGQCLGSGNTVLCKRETEREKWLAKVGCSRFSLDSVTAAELWPILISRTSSRLPYM